jgi:carnitine O-acetyltransferase
MAPKRNTSTIAEDPTVGPMYRYQRNLPHLPIPSLQTTALKYLETVKPIVSPAAFTRTKSAVESFVASEQGKELQRRLEARAAEPGMVNWLADWWNDVAYMSYRDPVVVFVSYFYVHLADKAPKSQARKAAELVKAMLPFRELVELQQLEPDKVRQTPLCMASYKWLFNSCRYPVIPSDTAHKFDPQSNNHVVFIRKNKFYSVPLEVNGVQLTTAELEAQVQNIIDHAGHTASIPVGALTSENRDIWANARETLVSSPLNAKSLERVESAVAVICLDDSSPQTRDELSWSAWVGNGRNRFYDKHQFIVFENGRSAFLGEHSCMDGTPTLRLNEFMLSSLAAGKIDHGTSQNPRSSIPAPEELKFDLNDVMKKDIKVAEEHFDELVGKHDLYVQHMSHYGSNFIKTTKTSPDAWAQLTKQLAFHKLFSRPGVTYESAQTRKFQRGRTEVIRAASSESKAWVDSMVDPAKSDEEREVLFRKAVARHLQYAAWAADAAGVDRHLFGLKKMLKEGEPTPEIYTDESYGKTNHWELSTSNLSSPWLDGWGYGEVVPDGYGLSYSIGSDYIRWTITSLKRDTKKFHDALGQASLEVKEMMEKAAASRTKKGGDTKPKL